MRMVQWEWPAGYRHYLSDHDIKPTEAFGTFILGRDCGGLIIAARGWDITSTQARQTLSARRNPLLADVLALRSTAPSRDTALTGSERERRLGLRQFTVQGVSLGSDAS